MNFLAHMYLSCTEQGLMCGNFLGDFIKNKEIPLLPPTIQLGITLHRRIDSFTDSHPAIKKCTRLLHPTQGKYAPVIVDVYFDYILFRNWKSYSGISFNDFEDHVYTTLLHNLDAFPTRLKKMSTNMIYHKFLRSYTTLEGLEDTFARIKKRTNFQSNMDHAVKDLQMNYSQIERAFTEFFPDIIKMSEDFCACHPSK